MKSSHHYRCALVLAMMVPSIAAGALHTNRGSASFAAVGPVGFHIQGKTSDVTVSEINDATRVRVALANLDTGIALRNRHMREKYLEVAKYPTAELAVARSTLKFPEEGKEAKGEANGNVTIHGKTKGVHFTYRANKGQGGFDVTGSMRIDIRDFGIDIPSYMGITVKPNVDIVVHFVAQDN